MVRRIRNKTDEPLSLPQLGVTLEPGAETDVPAELDYVSFSEAHFDETNDGGEAAPITERRVRRNSADVTNVNATDSASTDEGAQ